MNPLRSWSWLLAGIGLTAAALLLPPTPVLVLWILAMSALRRGHRGMLALAGTTLLINGLLMAWLTPGQALWGPFSEEGLRLGLIGATRLNALITANMALLQRLPMAAFLDGLRLPPIATGFLAALLIAGQDLGRDLQRIREARMLEGSWPDGRFAQVREGGRLLPALFLASWRRAEVRRDALRGAGIDVGPRFAPIVAVATLAVAGRMAFIVLPNIALTYVVVFLGGALYGGRVGFWAGFWAMTLTNLMISGFAPSAFLNAPAMGILGVLGGLAQPLLRGRDGAIWAAIFGVLGTLLFSILMDVGTWAMVPEFRTSIDLLWVRIGAGLAVNVVPAITNGILFAVASGPVNRAGAAWQAAGRP